jgi:hypothetical protein
VADIDALNQLLNNEAALFEASQRQAGAMRTQELLNQPLSSFNQSNPNLARDASEWVQAQQARERLRASGAIPQRPAPATATAPNPVNRPVNAAPQPPLSTSAPRGIDPMGFLNNAAGAYAGIQAAGFAEQAIQGGIDAFGDRVIPASVRPVYDRIFEEANRARGMYLPTPVAGITDAARALRGMPPLSPIAGFAAPIACSLFGQGCTDRTPDGVPYAGDSLPPFFGGQMHRPYGVYYEMQSFNIVLNFEMPWGGYYLGNVWGPIRGITPPPGFAGIAYIHGSSSTNPNILQDYAAWSSGNTDPAWRYRARIRRVERMDGQPDTGGNPAPLPGTPVTPSRSPVVQNPREITPGQPQARPANYPQTLPRTAPSASPSLSPAPNPATQPLTGIPGNTPIPPPVTNPPSPQPENPESPAAPPQSNRPWWLIPALVAGPVIASPLSRLNGGQARPSPPRIGLGTLPTSPTCSYDNLGISGKVDQTNGILNTIQTVQLAAMQAQLSQINSKLGDALPNGGISGFLKRFWDMFHIQRILSLLTFITTVHNAYMLSNALTQTLFGAFDNVLATFKQKLTDAEGEEIDTQEWVSNQIQNMIASVIGVENLDGIKEGWAKYNRIYQAAMNIVYTLQNIAQSILGALEILGNWIAAIGNAMKKFGVVAENAYRWMNPQPNFQNRFFTAIERLQDVFDAVENITGEVRDTVELVQELGENKQQLDTAISEAEEFIQDQISQEKRDIEVGLPRVPETDEFQGEPRETVTDEQLGRLPWEI